MHGNRATRAISRLGLGFGVGASAVAAALLGGGIMTRALPMSGDPAPVAVSAAGPPDTASASSTTVAATPMVTRPAPTTSTPNVSTPTTPPRVARTVSAPPVVHVPSPPAQPARGAGVAVAASANQFAFEVRNRDGSPARWDPCTPIHYVVNLADAPPTAAADISGAIARLEAATGVTFVPDGPTTEVPTRARPNEDQARYGHRWAPVLIAWVHNGASDYLAGNGVLGEGGATWVAAPGAPDVFVTGQIAIDTDTTTALGSGFGAGTTIGLLLLHELGHVMGLAHSGDRAEVMFPRLVPRTAAAYGPGDLAGLRLLSGGRCNPAPAAA